MRRLLRLASLLGIAVAVALLAVAGGSTAAVAQESTPVAAGGHPVVGAWVLDSNADDPANPPELVVFSADGTYVSVDAFGGGTIGVWEATGPNTATLTLMFFIPGPEGAFGGTGTVRADVEVAADGQSFTAPYTFELVGPDGASTGELGPATATATRIAVEQMGEPVGPMPTFEEEADGATPAP